MKAPTIALVVPLALGTACTHEHKAGAPAGAQQAAGGTVAGPPVARDPLMQPGFAIQGHGGDQIVTGRVADATGSQVTIAAPDGEKRTLQIVPQTWVQLDGQDVGSEQLAPGQAVRASFDVVDGQEVAVKIRAGSTAARASDATSQGTGSSDQTPTNDATNARPDGRWGGPPGSSGNPLPPGTPHW